jgi:hypothetical protein
MIYVKDKRPATDEELKKAIRMSEGFLRIEPSNLDGKSHAEVLSRYREVNAMYRDPEILRATTGR